MTELVLIVQDGRGDVEGAASIVVVIGITSLLRGKKKEKSKSNCYLLDKKSHS